MKQQEIILNTVETLTENGSEYKGIYIQAKGNIWAITQVTGKHNYVSIRKVTNNPFGLMGKQFSGWDPVYSNYKCADLKAALLIAETTLNAK